LLLCLMSSVAALTDPLAAAEIFARF